MTTGTILQALIKLMWLEKPSAGTQEAWTRAHCVIAPWGPFLSMLGRKVHVYSGFLGTQCRGAGHLLFRIGLLFTVSFEENSIMVKWLLRALGQLPPQGTLSMV